jgi:hypothetical protein
MRTLEKMVQQEVIYCVSSLITTLAAAEGAVSLNTDNAGPLRIACTDAMDLSGPIPATAEETMQEEGYTQNDDGTWTHSEYGTFDDDAATICDFQNLDPYDYAREIFEHWIVTDWLADKLAAKGEAVSKDIAGLTVWGRTTTGQAISMDHVIEQIYADLIK